MNGSYAQAKTDLQRIAIAAVSANELYFKLHPQGVTPGYGFYEDFLEPFIERITLAAHQEVKQAQLESLHDRIIREGVAKLELELTQELMEINTKLLEVNAKINQRLNIRS